MTRRLWRLRRDDDGQSLVFVLLIGVLTMLMLGTASTALISQIGPSTSSVDGGAANAAAEAGIEDFVAKVNTNCPPTDGYYCAWLGTGINSNSTVADPTNDAGTLVTGADGQGKRESFYWKVIYAVPGFARVQSTGQVPTGKANPKYRTKVLVADVDATPSFNNFQYYTKYETYPSDFVNSFYGPRTVQITSSGGASGSSLSGPGLLQWNGACTYVDAQTTPTCDPNHSTNICEDLYYPGDGLGRGTDAAWNNGARRPSAATMAALGTNSSFAYYSETGTFKPNSGSTVPETHNDTCDSSFEPNMVMTGPIYSQDAYLVDRGQDTGNSKNSMPIFNDYAYSMWNGTINGAQQALDPNGGYARAYPGTNGQITTDKTPAPVYTTNKLDLPANADAAKPLATCIYTGPTRILIKANIAYITSPLTPTSPTPPGPAYCYASTGSFTNAGGGGVVDAQVPIGSTLIYVQNPTSGTPSIATPGNPIFNLTASTPVPAPAPLTSLVASFVNNVFTPTAACADASVLAPVTNRQDFDCEASATPKGGTTPDVYGKILGAINTTLLGSAVDQTALQAALLAAICAQFNPSTLSSSNLAGAGYYYKVTVGVPSLTTAQSQAPTLTPADPFLQAGTTGGYTINTLKTNVSVVRCTSVSCSGNGAQTITSGNVSVKLSVGSPAVATNSFPWFGAQTGPNTYTDPNNDITPYWNGYGDVYVEGQLKGSLSIVAEHDIVATNDLTYSNTDLKTTTDGLALVADHNVRIYRPMTCTDNGTAGVTTRGYCPNDLTGVYNTQLSWPLPNNYPALKYTPDNAPSMTNTGQGLLYATIFTLRGCFMIDNFYRGGIGAGAAIYGGLYQYHRGPTSLPYQGRPYQGSTTKMPGVTLNYTFDNMRAGQTANGGLRVPFFPTPPDQPVEGRTWNVSSLSTGT
jgi:Tfp pilus assembly protein PilX